MCSNICRCHFTSYWASKHVIFSMRWQVFWRESSLNLALRSEHVNSKEPRLVTFIINLDQLLSFSQDYLHTICTLSTYYLQTTYAVSTHYLHNTNSLPPAHYLHIIYTLCTDTVHTIYTLSTHYLLTWPTSPRWWIISVPKSREWASVWHVWICSSEPRLDT